MNDSSEYTGKQLHLNLFLETLILYKSPLIFIFSLQHPIYPIMGYLSKSTANIFTLSCYSFGELCVLALKVTLWFTPEHSNGLHTHKNPHPNNRQLMPCLAKTHGPSPAAKKVASSTNKKRSDTCFWECSNVAECTHLLLSSHVPTLGTYPGITSSQVPIWGRLPPMYHCLPMFLNLASVSERNKTINNKYVKCRIL